jgi:outer membrane protein TolC
MPILLALTLAAAFATSAGEPAPPVEVLVREALARSPALAAARAKTAGASALERPAAALPDPMVEAVLQNADFPRYTVGEEDMSMAGVEVRQAIPYPGKRPARREAARAETALREAEVEAVARRIAGEVRILYARLYAVDQEMATLGAARELLDLISATAASRYATGEAEQEALLKAQLAITRLEGQRDDLELERHDIVAELNRWLDRTGEAHLGTVSALPQVELPAQPLEELAVARSSEVGLARAAVSLAEKKLAAVRLDVKPDFTPTAGLASRGSLGAVLTLRFGVEVPLWKSNKQLETIRAAEAEAEAARRAVDDAAAVARAEAVHMEAEWIRAERQILRYREGILPQTSAVFDAARASYLTGRGDFSTVVEDFALWVEARAELARLEADRYIAWAGINRLTVGEGAQP